MVGTEGLPVWAFPGDEAAHASLCPQPRPSLWGTASGRAPSWVGGGTGGLWAVGTLWLQPGGGGQPGRPALEEGSGWVPLLGAALGGEYCSTSALTGLGGSSGSGWVGKGSSTGCSSSAVAHLGAVYTVVLVARAPCRAPCRHSPHAESRAGTTSLTRIK